MREQQYFVYFHSSYHKGISKNLLFLFNLTMYPSPYQHFANALEREWQVLRNAHKTLIFYVSENIQCIGEFIAPICNKIFYMPVHIFVFMILKV